MWIFDQDAKKRLNSLNAIVSPSMDETNMADFLRQSWSEYGMSVETDVMGNLYSYKKGMRDINVAICAHMDTVALQITRILPNGMLQFRRIGLNPHVILGQRLVIKTSKGLINGVVGFDPTSQYGQPKGLIEEDLWIDICVSSQSEAEKYVNVGDLAIINSEYISMNNDYISGSFLDDKIGIFVMNECIRWYAERKMPINVCFVATTQEEVGLRGSAAFAAKNKFDACIILDVDYATDTLTPHENQMGVLNLGKGAALHIKADNNSVLRKLAVESAENMDIMYQQSLGRFIYGGTDASVMQLSGTATLNVSIPCRYIHSPIEICHKADVESAVNLLIATIESIGKRKSQTFIPGID